MGYHYIWSLSVKLGYYMHLNSNTCMYGIATMELYFNIRTVYTYRGYVHRNIYSIYVLHAYTYAIISNKS